MDAKEMLVSEKVGQLALPGKGITVLLLKTIVQTYCWLAIQPTKRKVEN